MTSDQIADVVSRAIRSATEPLMAEISALRDDLDAATGTDPQYRALRRHFPEYSGDLPYAPQS